jgi:hypothetical protein
MKGKYTTDPCARTDTRLYSRSLVIRIMRRYC